MIELKPCPFCGGEAELRATWIDKNRDIEKAIDKYVRCSRCFAQTWQYSTRDNERTGVNAADSAIQAWNRRQEKSGVWHDKKMTIKKAHGLAYGRWSCSACKTKQPHKSNFCPNCGADMREDGK